MSLLESRFVPPDILSQFFTHCIPTFPHQVLVACGMLSLISVLCMLLILGVRTAKGSLNLLSSPCFHFPPTL